MLIGILARCIFYSTHFFCYLGTSMGSEKCISCDNEFLYLFFGGYKWCLMLYHNQLTNLKSRTQLFNFCFLKFLEDMSPFCGATDILDFPYFGLLVVFPLGFKARVGSALFQLSGGVRATLHVP